jgi:hypothetical protein
MEKITLKAGIPKKQYEKLLKYIDDMNYDELKAYYSSIKKAHQNEYAECLRIWKLPEQDDLWDTYELMDTKGMPEQILFAKAAIELRSIYYKEVYPHVRKKAKEKSDNEKASRKASSGVGVQPEGN